LKKKKKKRKEKTMGRALRARGTPKRGLKRPRKSWGGRGLLKRL